MNELPTIPEYINQLRSDLKRSGDKNARLEAENTRLSSHINQLLFGPDPKGIPCTSAGCAAVFHAETVSDPGPHNNPPGVTGWQWHTADDDDLGVHDHRIDAERARQIFASAAGYWPSPNGKVYVIVTFHGVTSKVIDLEVLDREPGFDLFTGAEGELSQVCYVGNVNGGDSVPWKPAT